MSNGVYPDGTRDFSAQVHGGGGYVHSEHISNDRALELIRTHAPDNLRRWGKMHKGIIYRDPPNSMGSRTDITKDKFKQLANSPLLVSASLLHEHNLNQRSGGKIFDAEYNEAEEAVYVSFSLDLDTSEGQFLDGFIKGLEKDGKRAELSLSHILHPDTGDVIPLEVSLCEGGAREGTVLLAQASKSALRGSLKGSYLVRASKNAFGADHVDLSSVVSVAPVIVDAAEAPQGQAAVPVGASEDALSGQSGAAVAPVAVAPVVAAAAPSSASPPGVAAAPAAPSSSAASSPPSRGGGSGATASDVDMASAAAYSAMFFQRLRAPASHMAESHQVRPDDGLGQTISMHREDGSMTSVRQMNATPTTSSLSGRAPMDIETDGSMPTMRAPGTQTELAHGMYGTVQTNSPPQSAAPAVSAVSAATQMATATQPPQVTQAPQVTAPPPASQDARMDTTGGQTTGQAAAPASTEVKSLTGNAHPRDGEATPSGADAAERDAKRAARPSEAEVAMAAQFIGDIINRANAASTVAAAAAAASSTPAPAPAADAVAMDVSGGQGATAPSPAAPADDARLRALEARFVAMEAENRRLVELQRQADAQRSQQESEDRNRRAAHTKQLILANVADKALASQLAGMMDDPNFLMSDRGKALLVSASNTAVYPQAQAAARPGPASFSVPSASGSSHLHQLPMRPAVAQQAAPYLSEASGNSSSTVAPLIHQHALLVQASRSVGMGNQPLSILGRPLCDVQSGVRVYVDMLAKKHAADFARACTEYNFEPHIYDAGSAPPPPRRGAYIIQASRRASEHTSQHHTVVERQIAASMTAILSAIHKATKVAGGVMNAREISPGVFMPTFTTTAPEMPEI